MQLALPASPGFAPGPLSTTPLPKRMMIAGVTLAGASAIAFNPVAPALPTLTEVRDHAVALYAWENPLTLWQNTIQTSLGHVKYGLNAIGTETIPALVAMLTATPELLSEIIGGLTDATALQQLATDLPGYIDTITTGIQGSQAGLQDWIGELPTYLEGASNALAQGHFTEALQNINWWTLFAIGEAGWPLFETLEIPGDIAATLGMGKLANVFDALFTNNAAGNYTQAILSPFITAAFQFTEVLDSIVTAVKAGDWVTVASDVINMPAKVIGAFLNGYQPSFTSYAWPGLLTADGPLESFLFKIPNAIKWALSLPPQTAETATATTLAAATSELEQVTSTDVAAAGDLVTLDLSTAVTTEVAEVAAVTEEAVTEEAALTEEAAAEVPAEAPVTEEAATEVPAEAPVTEEAATDAPASEVGVDAEQTAPAKDTSAATEAKSDTKSNSKDAKSDDAKSDSKDAKSDDTKSDSKKDAKSEKGSTDKAESKSDKGQAKADKPKAEKAQSKSDSGSQSSKSDSGE